MSPSSVLRRRPGWLAMVLVALAVGLAGCGASNAAAPVTTTTLAPLPPSVVAYVTQIGSGSATGQGSTVRQWNLSEGEAGAGPTIGVGSFPAAIAITPDGGTAYVADYSSGTLTPIDLATGKPGRPIAAGDGPAGIAITPDGKTAYVTDAGVSSLADTLTPIDLATGKPEAPITVGEGPEGIAITPDGATAYVADSGAIIPGQSGAIGHSVTPVDLATGKALAPITVGNAPEAVALSPGGTTALVANSGSGSVTPIETVSGTALAALALDGSPSAIVAGATTAYVAVAPSGVAPGDNVTPIDLADDKAGKPVPVCKSPSALALSPDGSMLWVVCNATSTLEGIDLASGTVRATFDIGGGAYALALTTEATPRVVHHRARPKR